MAPEYNAPLQSILEKVYAFWINPFIKFEVRLIIKSTTTDSTLLRDGSPRIKTFT